MLAIQFIICVIIVVSFSILLSNKVDWFEKSTNISGMLIGFLLAAITSLPELVSGITSVLINQQELAISSILGSNLFNYNIVAVSNLAFLYLYALNNLKKDANKIVTYIIIMYLAILIPASIYLVNNYIILARISMASVIIIIAYILSVKALSSESEPSNEVAPANLIKRNLLLSLGFVAILVSASIILANLVEAIMIEINLSASLAGTVLLGASTSLPEFVGSLSLMRKKQFDIAISSVLSSNLFNFFVLGILDLITFNNNIITFFSKSTLILTITGLVTTVLMLITIKYYRVKNKVLYAIPSLLIIGFYAIYLIFFS